MSRSSSPKRGRGRPPRQYRIRVRGERRENPDYDALARALLEHAAKEEAERRDKVADATATTTTKIDGLNASVANDAIGGDADD
jgi:predicted ArsR family transcriptional regulator